MPTAGERRCRFIRTATFRPTLLRQIAKDIGLSVEDFLAAQPGQQPNPALQPTAGEADVPKKPSKPGRG
jgi:hypothetical protein